MRNRQQLIPGMKADVEAELEESLDNASTSSREGPPEGNIALIAVSKANLLPLTGTYKGIFFWDNTIVAINVNVKATAIDTVGKGGNVPPTGESPCCNRAVPAMALFFLQRPGRLHCRD